MRLPNVERAFVDRRKLAAYCLDPSHPVGRHKALVFQRALGWTADDADQLSQLLLRAALVEDAVIGQLDKFRQRNVVDSWQRRLPGQPTSAPLGSSVQAKSFLA